MRLGCKTALVALSCLACWGQVWAGGEFMDMAKESAAAFAKARQFPAEQLERIKGKPDNAERSGDLATFTWSSREKDKEWLVSVRIHGKEKEITIVTTGRSEGGKATKQLEKARAAALVLARDRCFPAAQMKEIEGPPVERVVVSPDGKAITEYQWLGNGKGGWYLHVSMDNVSDKVIRIDGGHNPD